MLMLPRSTWFEKVNVFILNSFSTKKVFIPKRTYPKEPPILKKWLLGISFPLKK